MGSFLKLERFTTQLALGCSIILLSISVMLGIYQVLTRFIFDAPSAWTEVVAIYLAIWSVFLAAAPAFRAGKMMSIDVIQKLVPANRLLLLEVAIGVCCLFVMGLLVWLGIELAHRVRAQSMAGFHISMAWAYAALPVGCGFSFIAILGRLISLPHARHAAQPASPVKEVSQL